MKTLPFVFLGFSLILSFSASAQETYSTRKTASPKVQRLFEKALEQVQANQLEPAALTLKQALSADARFIDGLMLLADVQHDLGQLPAAIEGYRQVLALDPEYQPRVLYQLAYTLVETAQYAAAAPYLEQYLSSSAKNERQRQLAERLLREARFAAEAVKNPVPFNPLPLDSTINTTVAEYLPSLRADGNLLIFTRVVGGQEDFYFVEKSNGTWGASQPLTALNTPVNEGAHCLSADGKTLVFTGCNQPGGLGSCDLYVSYFRNNRWTTPANLKAPVNSPGYESQPALSANGRYLIFASTRPGTLGGNDLWMSTLSADGRWSTPQNLGPAINTPEDDQAPFLHPDGQTLYFMSKGHPGMGGFDLFVSRRDSSGNWGAPQNLGYPINTRANEGAMIVSLDGSTAYFASDKGGKTTPLHGSTPTDIFQFSLPANVQPQPVTYARGQVLDARTRSPLSARISVREVGADSLYFHEETEPDGVFLVCLPAGKDYAFTASRDKYLFFSENFGLSEAREIGDPYLLDVLLQPVPEKTDAPSATSYIASEPVALRNVFFATGSANLRPESTPELEQLRKLLEDNPQIRIQINGHTDDVGEATANQALSEARAKAVYDYLIKKGIAPTRLAFKGFGETKPVAPNDTPQNRQRNRRTEFVVW